MNQKRARKLRRIAAAMAEPTKTNFRTLYRRLKRYWVDHGELPPGTDDVLRGVGLDPGSIR